MRVSLSWFTVKDDLINSVFPQANSTHTLLTTLTVLVPFSTSVLYEVGFPQYAND